MVMRFPTSFVFFRLCLLLSWVTLFVPSCRKPTEEPTPEGSPGQSLLRLSLPALPSALADPKSQRHQIVALLSAPQLPFTRAQTQFLHHLAAQDGRLELVLPASPSDTPASSESQTHQLATLLATPPSALLFRPIQPLSSSATASLTSLRDLGTHLIGLDVTPEQQSLFDASVSCDLSKIGKSAATLIIKALTQRAVDRRQNSVSGRIMVLRGSDADPDAQSIHAGLVAGLQAQPSLIIVHDAPADWSTNSAKTRFAEALRLQKPIDVVFAHDDLLAQAIHRAASEQAVRDDLFLVGVNGFAGSEGGIEMIRNHELDATCQRPFLVDVAWRLVQRHLAGEPPPIRQHLWLPPRPIVPSDLDHPEHLHPSVDDL